MERITPNAGSGHDRDEGEPLAYLCIAPRPATAGGVGEEGASRSECGTGYQAVPERIAVSTDLLDGRGSELMRCTAGVHCERVG